MDFIEEKTPKRISLKIFFKSWNFLAYDKKGKSIYPDADERTQLYKVPLIILLSKNISIKIPFNQEYLLAKIRNNKIIIEYFDKRDKKGKYLFIETAKKIDLIPMRVIQVKSIVSLVRELDAKLEPDYIAVDNDQSQNDSIIIKSKFKTAEIINIDESNNQYFINMQRALLEEDKVTNLNMISANPVYLARIHLRQMDLSKINQLLLDFDLNALDAEYIYSFLESILLNEKDPVVIKNRALLQHLRNSFIFFMFLIQKKDVNIREMIQGITNIRDLTPYQTLIRKAKSMFPNREDQLLYTEYENMIMNRRDELS